jgi:DNA-binding transcriptional ArsR family regulator
MTGYFAKVILCKVSIPAATDDLALAHPLRAALLDLVREHGTLTSTEAARLLGKSSGLCSFHLRQLARYGHIEEAPQRRGRIRPWRIPVIERQDDDGFGRLARELEDEGYHRWLAHKPEAPPRWQRDEAFSTVLRLTPDELAELGEEIRAVLERFRQRENAPARGPAGRRPVAAVARLFPLLPTEGR